MNGEDSRFLKELLSSEFKSMVKLLQAKIDSNKELQNERHEENKRELKFLKDQICCDVHNQRMDSIDKGMAWIWAILTIMLGSVVTGFFLMSGN